MGRAIVLVVEDDEAIVASIEMALIEQGYLVLPAVDGAAVPLARSAQPAVILLDLTMPGMDGVGVGRRLRADPATAGIPIVVMSAQGRLRTTGSLMAMDAQLPETFNLDRLYDVVGRWAVPA